MRALDADPRADDPFLPPASLHVAFRVGRQRFAIEASRCLAKAKPTSVQRHDEGHWQWAICSTLVCGTHYPAVDLRRRFLSPDCIDPPAPGLALLVSDGSATAALLADEELGTILAAAHPVRDALGLLKANALSRGVRDYIIALDELLDDPVVAGGLLLERLLLGRARR